jgi:phosphate transport system substrate-binding protein
LKYLFFNRVEQEYFEGPKKVLLGSAMKITKTFLLICGIMIAVSTAASSISNAGETITIGGMGSGLGVMKRLGEAFEKKHPGIKIQVKPSLGSAGGIRGVAKGALDIGISARLFRSEEKGYGLTIAEYGMTPLVIVTRKDTMVSGLNTEDLVRIYDGSVLTWPDGRRIRPVLRPEDETDTKIVKEISPEIRKALEAAMARPGMLVGITNQETTNIIEKTPGAFGFSSLAQVITEKLPLKILSFNGIFPSVGALSDGSYKLKKALFIVTRYQPSSKVVNFLNFVNSPAGTKILDESGYVVAVEKTGR